MHVRIKNPDHKGRGELVRTGEEKNSLRYTDTPPARKDLLAGNLGTFVSEVGPFREKSQHRGVFAIIREPLLTKHP